MSAKLVLDNKKIMINEKEIKELLNRRHPVIKETSKGDISLNGILLFLVYIACLFAGDFTILFIGYFANVPLWVSYFCGGIWGVIIAWAFVKGGKK